MNFTSDCLWRQVIFLFYFFILGAEGARETHITDVAACKEVQRCEKAKERKIDDDDGDDDDDERNRAVHFHQTSVSSFLSRGAKNISEPKRNTEIARATTAKFGPTGIFGHSERYSLQEFCFL